MLRSARAGLAAVLCLQCCGCCALLALLWMLRSARAGLAAALAHNAVDAALYSRGLVAAFCQCCALHWFWLLRFASNAVDAALSLRWFWLLHFTHTAGYILCLHNILLCTDTLPSRYLLA